MPLQCPKPTPPLSQELVANTTNDTAFSVNWNSTYGLIGLTYTPTQANVGKWSTFVAGQPLSMATVVSCCLDHELTSRTPYSL